MKLYFVAIDTPWKPYPLLLKLKDLKEPITYSYTDADKIDREDYKHPEQWLFPKWVIDNLNDREFKIFNQSIEGIAVEEDGYNEFIKEVPVTYGEIIQYWESKQSQK